MSEDEDGIEYLDEDEDIVQQCVNNSQKNDVANEESYSEDIEEKITPLLVERKQTEKRKYKPDEIDSDYDPNEDLLAPRKKRKIVKRPLRQASYVPTQQKSAQKNQNTSTTNQKAGQSIQISNKSRSVPKAMIIKKDEFEDRKNLNIRIPDYEDPLCLPVRATMKDSVDIKKLKHWNQLCLNHYVTHDEVLQPDRGKVKGSTRSVVLRNVKNKVLGKVETVVWGKNTVENEYGQKKSESYQSVLPRFREKKVLDPYKLLPTLRMPFKHTYEVILTKEDSKEGETLVAYKPKEAISAVYMLEEKKISDEPDDDERYKKSGVKELTCCKMCAPCYQVSWRGLRKTDKKDDIECPICERTFVSVYNLLSHLKSHHTHAEVRNHRALVSRALAKVVDYHYKCRICLQQFLSITQLRRHVAKHRGTDVFKCEIGNHMAS